MFLRFEKGASGGTGVRCALIQCAQGTTETSWNSDSERRLSGEFICFWIERIILFLLLSGREPTFLLFFVRSSTTSPEGTLTLFDLDRTRSIIEKVVSSEGVELVEVEIKGNLNNRVLRIYIDKPSGITHKDCEFISDQVGTLLEIEDVIPGSYTLEVSSPGLTRKLTKASDFSRFRGRLVNVRTRMPINGMKNFRGTLVGLEGDTVTVELKNTESVQIPLGAISRANLDIDF